MASQWGFPKGPPTMRLLTPADPAVGTGLDVTVTAGRLWVIQSVQFQLNASAVAGNRYITLFHLRGGNPIILVPGLTASIANSTNTAYFAEFDYGDNYLAAQAREMIGIPEPMIMEGGDVLRCSAFGLDAGDQITGGVIYVQEYQFT